MVNARCSGALEKVSQSRRFGLDRWAVSGSSEEKLFIVTTAIAGPFSTRDADPA
jgi:hypothetical protein